MLQYQSNKQHRDIKIGIMLKGTKIKKEMHKINSQVASRAKILARNMNHHITPQTYGIRIPAELQLCLVRRY
jgi:hypothetical protein